MFFHYYYKIVKIYIHLLLHFLIIFIKLFQFSLLFGLKKSIFFKEYIIFHLFSLSLNLNTLELFKLLKKIY
jgi:hypothetical protein